MPISTNVSLSPAFGEVYWIQYYVIKFVSDISITGMCPFIPSKHYQYFERYLKDKGLDITENGHSTLSSRHSYDHIYT